MDQAHHSSPMDTSLYVSCSCDGFLLVTDHLDFLAIASWTRLVRQYNSIILYLKPLCCRLKNFRYRCKLLVPGNVKHSSIVFNHTCHTLSSNSFLVGWTTHLKNMLLKMASSSPNIWVKIPKNLWVATYPLRSLYLEINSSHLYIGKSTHHYPVLTASQASDGLGSTSLGTKKVAAVLSNSPPSETEPFRSAFGFSWVARVESITPPED